LRVCKNQVLRKKLKKRTNNLQKTNLDCAFSASQRATLFQHKEQNLQLKRFSKQLEVEEAGRSQLPEIGES
jgi:hypothetical protein